MNPSPPNNPSERTLFSEALAKSTPAEREAFLEAACGDDTALRDRIRELLRNHGAPEGFMEDPAVELTTLGASTPLSEGPGTFIGRYKLLQRIGEGGMGSVFMAEQKEPVSRMVALKIIKLGMDTRQVVARFEAERQALAMMDHPNIARVLDAGATDTGRPYFVMELVKGIPIHEFCDKNQLTARERLELFIPVCHAIQHAHQKGVIHRDIKPSNVMVTLHDGRPVPKVIDFGIAKATHQKLTERTLFTKYAEMIGTPAYMSPEQAELSGLDIDTRTDVYSLGVLLYELLTGSTPFSAEKLLGAGYGGMQRIIREEEPERPSTRLSTLDGELEAVARHRKTDAATLSRELSGDLDWIVMKALEKDRARRYESATGLSLDIERHLKSEPVLAAPPSRAYLLRKFVNRHRPAVRVAALVGAVVLGLAAFLLEEFFRAEKLSRVASANAVRAEQAAGESARDAARARQAQAEEGRMRALADAQTLAAQRSEYAADMLLAQKLIAENSRGRAVELLDKYRMERQVPRGERSATASQPLTPHPSSLAPDLRGWEWHYLASQTRGQELAVLQGHRTKVNDVAFSPDGRWFASGGLDGVVNVWDPQTRKLSKALEVPAVGNLAEIFAIAFSPNGQWLAAGDELGRHVYFWDVGSWGRSFVLTNKYRVNGLAFSPDGRWLATGGHSGNGGIVVWDLARRIAVADWSQPNLNILPFALAFTPDSKQLVFDDGGGRLGRWDVATLQPLPALALHEGAESIEKAEFTLDGSMAVTGGRNAIVRVWSLPDWKQFYQVTNEALLTISQADAMLVTTRDVDVRSRRLITGELRNRFDGHTATVWAGAASSSAQMLASASQDHTVRLWPLDAPAPRPSRLPFPTNETRLTSEFQSLPRVSPDGLWVLTVQTNETLALWDARRLERVRLFPWPIRQLSAMALAPGGTFAAAGGKQGELVLVDMADGRIATQTRREKNMISYCAFSPDGTRLLLNSQAGSDLSAGYRLEILDAHTLSPIREIHSSGGNVLAAAFTPDNRHLALGYWNATQTEVVDLETGLRVARHTGHSGRILGIAITPDARLVASCAQDGPARVWDGRNGELFGEFRGTWEVNSALALSPDGSRLAASGNGIDIWDLVTRRLVQTLSTTNQWIYSFSWTPDLKQLTATGLDALFAWPADSYGMSRKPTNVLGAELDALAAQRRADRIEALDSDWRKDLPLLDEMVRRGDSDGFWRRTRALARAWKGDLAGAGEDDPALAIAPRDPRCTDRQLDLTRFYNQSVTADGFAMGQGLGELPTGFQLLGGTGFDFRGIVQLSGNCPDHAQFPKAVSGIAVKLRGRRLHFLQATSFETPVGTPVGHYTLHYRDGQTLELPILYGVDTRNWWTVAGETTNTPNAEVVWQGNCRGAAVAGQSIRLWKRTYDNPRPELEIASLDFVSAMNFPAPFLVAVTIE